MSDRPEGTGPGSLHAAIVDRILWLMDHPDRRWSVSELARRCGGYPKAPQLSDALAGKRGRTLNFRMVEAIAQAFGLSPVELVADGHGAAPPPAIDPEVERLKALSHEAVRVGEALDALGGDTRALIKRLVDEL